MTKNVTKRAEIKSSSEITPQEIRMEEVAKLKMECDPDVILKKFHEKLLQVEGKEVNILKDKEIQKLFRDAGMILGLDNHLVLAEVVKEDFGPFAIEFANNLAKEYGCKNPSEKALSHLVVTSYTRVMYLNKKIDNSLNSNCVSALTNSFLCFLGKELDRATRHLFTSLEMLKNIKSPELKVSIKTNNAFVAQNQQLNNHQPHENNNP